MLEGAQLGAYRVVRPIGMGGMGSVWLAEHTVIGRRAAIKVLHANYSADPTIVARFFNEARAATAISDPGIVQIFDFGQHTDGSAYIVMELLEGETLERRLGRLGRLDVPSALHLMRQVASSLGAAHRAGIIHRDLKPENIFIIHDPEVAGGERAKIVDFGIAKLGGSSTVKTNTSAIMGTPTWMSPEQCRGAGEVGPPSDVYSLGCVLFALLTGHPPFQSDGPGELLAMHQREPAPIVSANAPQIPPEVDQLLACCLAKHPLERPASGSELAAMIGRLVGSAPVIPKPRSPSTPPVVAQTASTPTTLSSASGVSQAPRTGTRRRAFVFAGIGLGVGAAGVAVLVVTSSGASAPAPAAAPAPQTTPPPAPAPAPNLEAQTGEQIKTVLTRFAAWANDHAGAPCPDLAAIGGGDDAWGHAIALTCTDQPADQRVGAISAGRDGKLGTDDDISSWLLGREITDVVRGPRWVAKAVHAATKRVAPVKTKAATISKKHAAPHDDSDIPEER